jgi:hypothetical protein
LANDNTGRHGGEQGSLDLHVVKLREAMELWGERKLV